MRVSLTTVHNCSYQFDCYYFSLVFDSYYDNVSKYVLKLSGGGSISFVAVQVKEFTILEDKK